MLALVLVAAFEEPEDSLFEPDDEPDDEPEDSLDDDADRLSVR